MDKKKEQEKDCSMRLQVTLRSFADLQAIKENLGYPIYVLVRGDSGKQTIHFATMLSSDEEIQDYILHGDSLIQGLVQSQLAQTDRFMWFVADEITVENRDI